MDSLVDRRFGRAKQFLVADTESGEYTIIDNTQNLNAEQGAGLQSAQNVINAGATAVITGHTGPKAFNLLTSTGVAVYNVEDMPVRKALELFKSGKLARADRADVKGHW
jgi:predicted Fe-Mo cluster-binding NifX family protein